MKKLLLTLLLTSCLSVVGAEQAPNDGDEAPSKAEINLANRAESFITACNDLVTAINNSSRPHNEIEDTWETLQELHQRYDRNVLALTRTKKPEYRSLVQKWDTAFTDASRAVKARKDDIKEKE